MFRFNHHHQGAYYLRDKRELHLLSTKLDINYSQSLSMNPLKVSH
jgi:hypothetical protein